jgi:predicted MPP superfamily phosphohydrolase
MLIHGLLRGAWIGDFIISMITITTQVLIARRFFSQWRRRLPPALGYAIAGTLFILWASFLFAIPFRYYIFARKLTWIPLHFRSAAIATGNLWGITAVASYGLFLLYSFFAVRRSPSHSPERRKLMQTAGTIAVAAPFAAAAFGGIVERTNFQVKEIDLPVPNLHPDLEGLRIGQLSDLHVSPWLTVRELSRAVDMLNERKPNLTVVTGDLISQAGDPLDNAIREIGRLRADAGVLGCLGNHERYVRCSNYETREAAKYGIEMLRSQTRILRWGNGVLNVAGVDHQSLYDGDYLVGAEKLVVPGAVNLLLSHNPDVFPVAVRKGFDTMLSGHTHGGQVTVEILNQTLNFARFSTPYVAGLYRLDGRSCYVTAGIGTIGLPIRIGALPEITVVRLTRA